MVTKIFTDDYEDGVDGEEIENEEEEYTESSASNDFEKFFREYKENGKFYYIDRITELAAKPTKEKTFLVRHMDLEGRLFDYIYGENTRHLESNLKAMSEAARSIFTEYFPDYDYSEIKNIEAKLSIDDPKLLTKPRNINISNRQKIIVFNCLIASQTENKPVLKEKIWECRNCGATYTAKRLVCSSDTCKKQNKDLDKDSKIKSVFFSLHHSRFTDYQTLEIQELQDDVNSSNMHLMIPKQITVKVYDKLVDKFKPGDNVQIVGIPKLEKTVSDMIFNRADTNSEFSNDLTFDLVIEAHNIQMLSSTKNQTIADPTKLLSQNDINNILEFKKKHTHQQIIDKLESCFAYWVYGNRETKILLLLQSVGSNSVKVGKGETKRGEINILMVGDPGVTKTILINAAMGIHTKSMFTSGKGSSGVGLTASIDTTQKGLNKLKIGAVVLSDGGICGVDEFLLIGEEAQDHLLQCMENGVIDINKQSINVRLNARTAILGACNPQTGKYNPRQVLADQVPLSPAIWSRWDCVTIIRDLRDAKKDDKVADHIISMYEPDNNFRRPADDDFLFKWMIYARTHNTFGIKFTKEAKKKIKEFYASLRKSANDFDVTATPRQLEAVVRLCVAKCKILLEDIVTEDMVIMVTQNMTHHYVTAGLLNLDSGEGLVQTAQYSAPLNKLSPKAALYEVVMMLTKGNTQDAEILDIEVELIRKANWQSSQTKKVITEEIDAGRLVESRQGWVKLPSH